MFHFSIFGEKHRIYCKCGVFMPDYIVAQTWINTSWLKLKYKRSQSEKMNTMSEIITSPRHFYLLYYEGMQWNMVELHLSACGSFYSASNSLNYDILHESDELRDLLKEHSIKTVAFDGRHIILNRGNVVEDLKDLVAEQEQEFDKTSFVCY